MKYLAIDYGEKYTGVAISDDNGIFSFPHSIIKYSDELFLSKKIVEICDKENIEVLVLGMPESNIEDDICKKIKEFSYVLKRQFSIPIYFQNERGTTKEVEFLGKKQTHSTSAALILQSYLENA